MQRQFILGGVVGGLVGAMLGGSRVGQAAEVEPPAPTPTITRTAIVPVAAWAYYTVGTGPTYSIDGDATAVRLTATHHLKTYQKTTWTVTAHTDVTTNG